MGIERYPHSPTPFAFTRPAIRHHVCATALARGVLLVLYARRAGLDEPGYLFRTVRALCVIDTSTCRVSCMCKGGDVKLASARSEAAEPE